MRPSLPIDAHLDGIVAAVRDRGAAVVVAPPGAGKTTRVPPALLELGRVVLLQPRRVAARALARRIAAERGGAAGDEVGWQVRFERRLSPSTRLLVATEGVLTSRLQSDPLLSDFDVVVLDEFHERSLHADLALALSRQAARARDGLRIVVMSATIEAGPVAAYLGGCPVIEIPGRLHPVTVEHAPGLEPADAVGRVLARSGGHCLVFLPGAPEIRRVAEALERRRAARDAEVLPLYGGLDADAQDRALAPSSRRKVILATNLAETSLTVDGVTDVVDTGLQKTPRYDAAVGLDRLRTERIAADSAAQRAGRAGRTGPGRVLRLWDPRDELRPRREPEVQRVDLAGPFLQVLASGEDPRRFPWFEPPADDRASQASAFLEAIGAAHGGRITALGDRLRRFPLHPRLARVLLDAGGGRDAAAVCAVLAEGFRRSGESAAGDSDPLADADALASAPPFVRRAAEELEALAASVLAEDAGAREARGPAGGHPGLLRAILAGFADRVARRRGPGSDRFVLRSGHGAVLDRRSVVRSAEWVVAVDVEAASHGAVAEARIRAASRIERDWLAADRTTTDHAWDEAAGAVRAFRRERLGALVLTERPVSPDPERAAALLESAFASRGLPDEAAAFLRRARFAGVPWTAEAWIRAACGGRSRLSEVDLAASLPRDVVREVSRLAPETVAVPSGRRARLDYGEDGSVSASVKLQEMFGLAEAPRVGPRSEPVTLVLLAPNGRPVQTTRDLSGFWERTYPEIRKELRGRYPRHPWPEDPWTAPPTHRVAPRRRRSGPEFR